jgi:hypothetical protein
MITLTEAIFALQELFNAHDKEGELKIVIDNNKKSPVVTFTNKEESISNVCDPHKKGDVYERELGFTNQPFVPKLGDKFIVLDEEAFLRIAHPSRAEVFKKGITFKLIESSDSAYEFRGVEVTKPISISSAFTRKELVDAYREGAIKSSIEANCFNESFLEIGFKFTILDEERWLAEVEWADHYNLSGEVEVVDLDANEDIKLKSSVVSRWYRKSLVVEALLNGIATYELKG